MSTISASTTSTTGYVVTSDTTGTLVFKTGASPTTAMSISSSQIISFTNPPTATGGGSVSTNTAYGTSALQANTTGANITAVGYQAGYSNTDGGRHTFIGTQAGYSNTSGLYNAALGFQSLYTNTTGNYNSAIGYGSLLLNTTGSNNVAVGHQSLFSNTTASNNTAVGYQAGYSNTTSQYNVNIGALSGYSNTTGLGVNVFVGYNSGNATTSAYNTFVGGNSGYLVSTGAKNTILGNYSGNQGGLDIRTASNYIVLSDGDGNPLFGYNAGGLFGWIGNSPMTASGSQASLVITGVGNGNHVSGTRNTLWLRNNNASGNQSNFFVLGSAGGGGCLIGNDLPADGTGKNTLFVQAGGSGGVNLTSGATSWTSASDARLKNVTGTYTNALADIAQIEAVKFTWKADQEAKPQVGVLAQSVQAVVPEAIDTVRVSKEDETDYLSVRYTELIPLLVASIQQLKAEIDTLKGQA